MAVTQVEEQLKAKDTPKSTRGGLGVAYGIVALRRPQHTRAAAMRQSVKPTNVLRRAGSDRASASKRDIDAACAGCGVQLQTTDKLKHGFVTGAGAELLRALRRPAARAGGAGHDGRDSEAARVVCQRCFRAKHYGDFTPVTVPYSSFLEQVASLRRIAPPGSLVVHVVDVTDFGGSVVEGVSSLVGHDKPLLVVVNKCDLLPKGVKYGRLERWVRAQLRETDPNMHKHLRGVVFVSSITGMGFSAALERIDELRKGGDAFVVGAANSGKSSFVNQLLHNLWQSPAFDAAEWAGDMYRARRRRKDRRNSDTIVLNEAPDGYREGDVFTGDVDALRKQARAEQRGVATGDTPAGTGVPEGDEVRTLPGMGHVDVDSAITVESSTLQGGSGEEPPSAEPFLGVPLTTSPVPGTTLGIISGPLPSSGRVHDTPGIVVDEAKQRLFEQLASGGSKEMAAVIPGAAPIPPQTYRVYPGQSLYFGGLARLDYTHPVDEVAMLFTWIGPLQLHRTRTSRADELFERHAGGMLAPARGPLSNAVVTRTSDWATPHDGKGNPQATRRRRQTRTRRALFDVALSGLGFLAVTPIEIEGMHGWDRAIKYGVITVHSCDGVSVQIRDPLLPFDGASGTGPKEWK